MSGLRVGVVYASIDLGAHIMAADDNVEITVHQFRSSRTSDLAANYISRVTITIRRRDR